MMTARSAVSAALLFAFSTAHSIGCAPKAAPAGVAAGPVSLPVAARDHRSSARPEQVRVTHVDLDLSANFETRRLSGTASLTVVKAAGASRLVVDTVNLDIRKVEDGAGRALPYRLLVEDSMRGVPLEVDLRPATDVVVITYRTHPDAPALQWLPPALTASKRHPFLFSQGQDILTRSWIPTQDSPGIRQTYSARIDVPAPLRAVMSAEMLTPEGEEAAAGRRAFRFRMKEAIPPYLIAIAIGDVAFRALGPRTGVYAEPAMLTAAAAELVDTERMLEAAERLFGPYRWGRYDMLVLPPSFPYGGMENPRLTFLTPTMLAGDRSLVSLIAHELAHSWSGNLVTNATWGDFWLNEGFTTYIEYRIMEVLYGKAHADMLARLGWSELEDRLEALGPTSPDTRLRVGPEGRDPNAEGIVYEKGAHFLRTVEVAVGRPAFDAWLRSYFDRYAFQPMTTEKMLEDMRSRLLADRPDAERAIGLDAWCYAPGVPTNVAIRQSDAFAKVEGVADSFVANGRTRAVPFESWSTQEQLHFLDHLPRRLPIERLSALDRAFGLSARGNREVLFAWLQLALKNRYPPSVSSAEAFLTSMGRRKFVVPILKTLMAEESWGQKHARRIYDRAAPTYHPVTRKSAHAVVYPDASSDHRP